MSSAAEPSAPATTPAALARLAHGRDEAAWAMVLERHGLAVQGVCRRILRDEALAEDACQETWLQVRALAGRFRSRGEGLQAEAAARGWLLSLAANVALHLVRKQRRTRAREAVAVIATPQHEERVMDPERSEAVRRELAELREAERLPIVMHYYGGMDYAQLASALDCPVGTVKARVSRGLEKLRKRLVVLGLVLALSELEAFFRTGSQAHAADAAATCASPSVGLTQEQLAPWRELLHSNREPGMPGMAPNEGVSTMMKITGASLAAVCVLSLALMVGRSDGADAPPPKENPPPPVVAAPVPQSVPAEQPVRHERMENPRPPIVAAPVRGPIDPRALEADVTPEEKAQAAADLNQTAFDLYRHLMAGKDGNLIFSPYSISLALGMTRLGARGTTADEMDQALHFSQGARTHAALRAHIATINNPSNGVRANAPVPYSLSVVNRLFGQQGYPFQKPFLDLSEDVYGAGLQAVNFGDKAAAAKTINTWVEKQTKDRIKDLVSPGDMNGARMVLVNAIYFKSKWADTFSDRWTEKQPFFLANGKQVTAQLMNKISHFNYVVDKRGVQVVEIPYEKKELSMVVVLPSKQLGLAGVEALLSGEQFAQWGKEAKAARVRVRLPRFKMEWGASLVEPLEQQGIKRAFVAGQADFTGIAQVPNEPLFIGNVIHKAFIEVDEAGTEAAAATAVVMKAGSAAPRQPEEFRADRPFVYAIRHNKSGAILFLGRVTDPTKTE